MIFWLPSILLLPESVKPKSPYEAHQTATSIYARRQVGWLSAYVEYGEDGNIGDVTDLQRIRTVHNTHTHTHTQNSVSVDRPRDGRDRRVGSLAPDSTSSLRSPATEQHPQRTVLLFSPTTLKWRERLVLALKKKLTSKRSTPSARNFDITCNG